MTDKKFNGLRINWTQPLGSVCYNPYYQTLHNAQDLERELDRLDAVDVLVDEMLTYPDAEAIINKLTTQGN